MEVRAHIKALAGVNSTQNYEKYLGLPSLIGRSQVRSFKNIEGRIWDRLNGWKEKFLTQARKEVLLKSVIQAIPTYTMSVFKLPKTLCKKINSMMLRFWWGHKDNLSKLAWMGWDKMGLKKEGGSLGYRDLEFFNQALLAKQGWRLVQNPNSLAARVLKAKYFPNNTFLESNMGRSPSYAWRSIWEAKKVLQARMLWRVGDGQSIRIWRDRWLPTCSSHMVQSPVRILEQEARVGELIDVEKNWWNIPLIEDIFMKEEVEVICNVPICPGGRPDRMVWAGTKNGAFIVRSGDHLA